MNSMSLMHRALYPCEQIREFTYDYLEGGLPYFTRVRFHLHLMGCPNCKEFIRLYRIAANPTKFLEENPIPEDLVAHTLEFLDKELGRDSSHDSGQVPPPGAGSDNFR